MVDVSWLALPRRPAGDRLGVSAILAAHCGTAGCIMTACLFARLSLTCLPRAQKPRMKSRKLLRALARLQSPLLHCVGGGREMPANGPALGPHNRTSPTGACRVFVVTAGQKMGVSMLLAGWCQSQQNMRSPQSHVWLVAASTRLCRRAGQKRGGYHPHPGFNRRGACAHTVRA